MHVSDRRLRPGHAVRSSHCKHLAHVAVLAAHRDRGCHDRERPLHIFPDVGTATPRPPTGSAAQLRCPAVSVAPLPPPPTPTPTPPATPPSEPPIARRLPTPPLASTKRQVAVAVSGLGALPPRNELPKAATTALGQGARRSRARRGAYQVAIRGDLPDVGAARPLASRSRRYAETRPRHQQRGDAQLMPETTTMSARLDQRG